MAIINICVGRIFSRVHFFPEKVDYLCLLFLAVVLHTQATNSAPLYLRTLWRYTNAVIIIIVIIIKLSTSTLQLSPLSKNFPPNSQI